MKKFYLLCFVLICFFGCTKEGARTTVKKDDAKTARVKVTATFQTLMSKTDAVQISSETVTFVDDSERTEALTLKRNPKKVAVLYGSYAVLWAECGGTVSIGIGGKNAVALYEEQIGRDITQDKGFIEVAKTSAAIHWDIEKILVTQPDLIICSTAMRGYETIAAHAQQANIPVIAVSYSSIKDYVKWAKVFTALNSREDLYETVTEPVAQRVAEIIDKIPPDRNVKVLSLFPSVKTTKANLANSSIGDMLVDLKATNIAQAFNTDSTAERVDLNIEQIFKADPEYILIQVQESEAFVKKNLEKTLAANPIWNELSAVKNNKVYFLPKELFHNRANKSYAEAYKMLAALLYPDIEF